MPKTIETIYEIRQKGIELCKTDGSEHYKCGENEVEAMEFAISKNRHQDFILTSIIKYADRYGKTGNLKDLAEVSDYAHILAGANHG